VVADQKDGVHIRTDALHHLQRFGAAGDEFRRRVQFLNQEIGHSGVAVVDDDAGGATLPRALNGRVGLGGHQFAEALVLFVLRADVIHRHDAGDAFHVNGDQDGLHGIG
jgi:hypothetical protein